MRSPFILRSMREMPSEWRRRSLKKYDLLVCSGGDGTLDEVVTGIMQSNKLVPVGYIPAGSTNDFANSLGIPKNMKAAAETVVDGRLFACDIGAFNDDTFVYIAAFGLFTDVSYETKTGIQKRAGAHGIYLEGMKRLPSIKSYQMKFTAENLEIEGGLHFRNDHQFHVCRGASKRITGKYVELDDGGKFEVTLIKRPANAIELNQILTDLVNRNIDTDQMYTALRLASLHIESEEEVPWTPGR